MLAKIGALEPSNAKVFEMDDGGSTPWGRRSLALPGAANAGAFNLLTVAVQADIVDVMRFLRDDPGCRFVNLIDVTAVDYPKREKRFDVVYHLLSPTLNARIRLRAEADETTQVPSIIEVFPGADWFERETYDLYGVIFIGHPDMRRLLTDYGFEGHPLRKDFPLTGFVEVRYDDQEKRVLYEPVRLYQEFRNFDFLSPWEGADYPLPGMRREAANSWQIDDRAQPPQLTINFGPSGRMACCDCAGDSTAGSGRAGPRIRLHFIAAPKVDRAQEPIAAIPI
jgi:NADH-quinone oxidoreductase subunit C